MPTEDDKYPDRLGMERASPTRNEHGREGRFDSSHDGSGFWSGLEVSSIREASPIDTMSVEVPPAENNITYDFEASGGKIQLRAKTPNRQKTIQILALNHGCLKKEISDQKRDAQRPRKENEQTQVPSPSGPVGKLPKKNNDDEEDISRTLSSTITRSKIPLVRIPTTPESLRLLKEPTDIYEFLVTHEMPMCLDAMINWVCDEVVHTVTPTLIMNIRRLEPTDAYLRLSTLGKTCLDDSKTRV
jgi:hypothetical protein